MAGQCDFCACCSCQDWVSYKNKMFLAQLVTELADPEWQEKVMLMGDKMTLMNAVSLLEVLEMGKASKGTLKPGAVEEVSLVVKTDHQKVKVVSKLGTGGQLVARPNKSLSQTCKCCGSKGHLSGLQERREKGPSIYVDCQKCAKLCTLVAAVWPQ